jgi:hypothetical protein
VSLGTAAAAVAYAAGAQFAFFVVQKYIYRRSSAAAVDYAAGAQFACFSSTKVQVLTPCCAACRAESGGCARAAAASAFVHLY